MRNILGLTVLVLSLGLVSDGWTLTRSDVIDFCLEQSLTVIESGRTTETAESNVWNEGYSYNNTGTCPDHSDFHWEEPRGTLFEIMGVPFKYGGCDDASNAQYYIYDGAGMGCHWCHWILHGCSSLDCPDFAAGLQCSALWSIAIGQGCLSTAGVVTYAEKIEWGDLRPGDAVIRQWKDGKPGHTIVFDSWNVFMETFYGFEASSVTGVVQLAMFVAEDRYNDGFEPWCAKVLVNDPGSRIEEFALVSREANLQFRLVTICERETEGYQIIWSPDGQSGWQVVSEYRLSAGNYTTGAEYEFSVSSATTGYFRIQEIEVGGKPINYDTIFVSQEGE